MKIEYFNRCFKELNEKYRVENIIAKNTKVIFVLESPHVDELIHKSPVSGLSGVAMSKVLFENEQRALGIKLKEEFVSENLTDKGLGIMNICNIPMQRLAYQHEEVEKEYGKLEMSKYDDFFDVLEKLRVNTKPKYKDKEKEALQGIILDEFKRQLDSLPINDYIFVPCGKTAQTFFEIANVKYENSTTLNNIPHPSFGNWYKEKYKGNINSLLDAIS